MLANGLSVARIFLAPAVVYGLYRDGQGVGPITLALMLVAGSTDFLDGWAARRWGQPSRLGRMLDPLADKLFIGCVCISLVLLRGFPLWLVILQVTRDVAIVGVGTFLLRSRQLVVPASTLGKIATWAMALSMLAHVLSLSAPWDSLSQGVTAVFIVASAGGYARSLVGIVREPSLAIATQSPAVASSCNLPDA
jgi:CDP-diacylglycerol--glycerol-3-phosphate 3-phosphatidyltransferase